MVISGNQKKVARVTESGRGMGVEVTERDHDDNRERDEGCDQPLPTDHNGTEAEITPEMPHERCKQPQSLNLHPQSHFHLQPCT